MPVLFVFVKTTKTPELLLRGEKLSSVFHVLAGFDLHFCQQAAELLDLFAGQTAGDAALPAGEDLGKLGQKGQGLLRGVELHDALVRGGGGPGDKTILFQNGSLPGNIALVDADQPGQTVLGDTGAPADLRQITGVAGLQAHGGQLVRAVLHTAAGNFCDILDDLRHMAALLGLLRLQQFYHGDARL